MNELEGIASLMAKAHENGYQQGAAAGRAEIDLYRKALAEERADHVRTRDHYAAINGEVERLRAVAVPDEWLPIETFPYEEKITVDLYVEYRRYADCIWLPDKEAWAVELPTSRGEFIRMENFEPTHWRPVPPPPAASQEGEG